MINSNPFTYSKHLVFDFPWAAQIQLEVIDMMGQCVMMSPLMNIAVGWEQKIEVDGSLLP